MRIAGLQKCSFVDYPGKLAAAVFTPGCNLDCFYCHNRRLLGGAARERIDPDDVLAFLAERQGLLDGLVVSGGEPTLQRGLADFLRRVRELSGYAVKLDTNGTNPARLRRLVDAGLVDFVAMDVKAPLDGYEAICGRAVDTRAIEASIDLLLGGRVEYEFRTTLAPPLTAGDVMRIAVRIRGARRYAVQQYRRPQAPRAAPALPDPLPDAYVWACAEAARPFVQQCTVRGLKPVAARTSVAAGPVAAEARSLPPAAAQSPAIA